MLLERPSGEVFSSTWSDNGFGREDWPFDRFGSNDRRATQPILASHHVVRRKTAAALLYPFDQAMKPYKRSWEVEDSGGAWANRSPRHRWATLRLPTADRDAIARATRIAPLLYSACWKKIMPPTRRGIMCALKAATKIPICHNEACFTPLRL